MIIHLPIFNVILPANLSGLFNILLPFVTFDFLAIFTEPFYQDLYPQPSEQEFMEQFHLDQMVDVGYESFNPLINLGTLGIMVFFYIWQVIFLLPMTSFFRD